MIAKGLTPILNVSDIRASIAWFEKLGWKKCWEWVEPGQTLPGFGAVGSGDCEIFLCHGGQGSKGRGPNRTTYRDPDPTIGRPEGDGDDTMDKGVWMSVWVDDVDAVHRECLAAGLDVTQPPTDEPWGVSEMHIRHPDGHVFRISKGRSA